MESSAISFEPVVGFARIATGFNDTSFVARRICGTFANLLGSKEPTHPQLCWLATVYYLQAEKLKQGLGLEESHRG